MAPVCFVLLYGSHFGTLPYVFLRHYRKFF